MADSETMTFVDDDARVRHARRVAEMIADAMRANPSIATDVLLRERIGSWR